jgi:hypothetical protein
LCIFPLLSWVADGLSAAPVDRRLTPVDRA